MPDTPRLHLPYPALLDIADVPADMGELATALDTLVGPYGQGPVADRPISTPGQPGTQGRMYLVTDISPYRLDLDYGTGWQSVGFIGDGAILTNMLADHSVTRIKLAMPAVGDTEIFDNAVIARTIADGQVTLPKIAPTMRPSQGAGASAEALRALGANAGMAAPGIHAPQHAPGGADPLSFAQMIQRGPFSSRPVYPAAGAAAGLLYYAYDTATLYYSLGVSGWEPWFSGVGVLHTPYGGSRHLEAGTITVSYSGFSSSAGGSVSFFKPFISPPTVVYSVGGAYNVPFPQTFGLSAVSNTGFSLFSYSDGGPGVSFVYKWMAEGPD